MEGLTEEAIAIHAKRLTKRLGVHLKTPAPSETTYIWASFLAFHTVKESLMFVVPGAADLMKFSTTSITLHIIKEEIKKLHKKMDLMLNEPRESAMQDLEMGLNAIEYENFEEAQYRFRKAGENAAKGFNLATDDKGRIQCTKLKIFSQVMTLTFDPVRKTFIPADICPLRRRREIGSAVQASLDLLMEKLTGVTVSFGDVLWQRTNQKIQEYQDNVDQVLTAAYPFISCGQNHNDPNKLLSPDADVLLLRLMPKYIAEGLDDAIKLKVGCFNNSLQNHATIMMFRMSRPFCKDEQGKQQMVQVLNSRFNANDLAEKPLLIKIKDKVLTIVKDVDEKVDKVKKTTLLHVAAKEGRLDVAEYLLKDSAPSGGGTSSQQLNAADCQGDTPLMVAAENGQKEMVTLLIEYHPVLDKANLPGETALIKAAQKGHEEVVRILVQSGCAINKQTKFGKTAASWAFSNRHMAIVDYLVSMGANTPTEEAQPPAFCLRKGSGPWTHFPHEQAEASALMGPPALPPKPGQRRIPRAIQEAPARITVSAPSFDEEEAEEEEEEESNYTNAKQFRERDSSSETRNGDGGGGQVSGDGEGDWRDKLCSQDSGVAMAFDDGPQEEDDAGRRSVEARRGRRSAGSPSYGRRPEPSGMIRNRSASDVTAMSTAFGDKMEIDPDLEIVLRSAQARAKNAMRR